MHDPNESKPSNSAGPPPMEPVEAVAGSDESASADTNAQTFIQRTQSESGNEAAQLSASQRLPRSLGEGAMLGPYQIVRKLGQGGMGAVYEARHTKLKKTVAVKVLPPEMMKSPTLVARFEREMEAVGKLDDPHIVRAMDAGEFQGTHFLVMEFVDGSDLSQRVKEHGPLSVAEACDAIRQAALGLQHAHEYGLVHRDIKPSKLLMAFGQGIRGWGSGASGPQKSMSSTAQTKSNSSSSPAPNPQPLTPLQIKILDLGLARLEQDESLGRELTSSGQVLGTPDYMAPEQWDDTHTVDARADLYSLGCTLFYLLTGKAPYSADKPRSMMHLMKAHIDGEIPDLTARCPDVPAELNAIYRRLLAKKPEDRLQTAAEVAAALEPFVQRSPVAPRQESRTEQDVIRATDAQATTDVAGASGHPVAERQGYVDAPTTSILRPNVQREGSSRGAMTATWKRLIAAALLACVVLAVVFSRVGRDTSPTDSTNSASRAASAPGQSQASDDVRGLTPSGSPVRDAGWHGWPADAPPPAIAPFDAEQAAKHQEAWAKYLNVPVEYENSLGMKFRLIPPGEFLMGSTPEEIKADLKYWENHGDTLEKLKSEVPQHKVILTLPIYLSANEVTQAEYEKVMGTNPSKYAPMGTGKVAVAGQDTSGHPVETVSWNDAAEFCAKLSRQEQLKPFYFRAGETITPLEGTGYRLPSEAQWEFSCRAGTTTKYWVGDKDEDLMRAGWFGANSGSHTHAVGELIANPFGIYDIHGNVFEWVQDWQKPTYYGQFQTQAAVDPSGPSSAQTSRVLRGWAPDAGLCRSAMRYWITPSHRMPELGFRVSLPIDAVRQALKVTGPALPRTVVADVEQRPGANVEREVAEWVIKHGGEVWMQQHDHHHFSAKTVETLPTGPFVVTGINLSNKPGLPAEEWKRIAELRALESLNLEYSDVTDDVLVALLDRLPTLVSLDADGNPALTDTTAAAAARHGRIISLQLGGSQITSAGVRSLGTLSRMRHLSLGYCKQVTDEALAELREMKRLETLYINATSITAEGLERFPALPRLRVLYAGGLKWTPAAMQRLLECPELDYATLNHLELKLEALRVLAAHPSLTVLPVDGILSVTEQNIAELQREFTRCWLQHPAGPGLRSQRDVAAWLQSIGAKGYCRGPNQFYDPQGALPAAPFDLTHVEFTRRPETKTDWQPLAVLHGLQELTIAEDWAGDADAVAILRSLPTSAPNVWYHGFRSQITDATLKELAKRTRILGLNLGECRQLTAQGLQELKTLTRLQRINVVSTAADDSTFLLAATLSELRALSFDNNPTNGSGLSHLKGHQELSSLSLSGTPLRDDGLAGLADVPGLRELDIRQTPITDAGLAHLQKCRSLRILHAENTKVTAAGVAALEQALPQCTIFWEGNRPGAKTANAASDPPIDFAAERKAAEIVLALGGRVELESEQGQPVGLVDSRLPDVPFAVRLIDLEGKPNVKDDDLAVLQGCRRLRSVNLKATSMTGAVLAHLRPSRATLTRLNLDNCQLTDAGMAPLAEFTSLRELDLTYNGKATDAGLTALKDLTRLEVLYLPYEITDDGLRALTGLHRLRELHISSHRLSDAGLDQLFEQNPDLERVGISNGARTAAPLAKLRRLRHVSLDGRQFSAAGLRVLQTLPELRSLRLTSLMTANDVSRLSELPQLRQVEIYYSHGGDTPYFGDAAFASLARLPNLEHIHVHGAFPSPTDAVLEAWAKIPTLKGIQLVFDEPKRQYTAAGIAKFRTARPDVLLAIVGKVYPASSAIPFSVIQKLDETDPLPKWELPEGSPPPVVAPCKPDEATALQQKWAEHLKRPVVEELDVAKVARAAQREGEAPAEPRGGNKGDPPKDGSAGASPSQDATTQNATTLKFALIPPGEFRKIFTRPRDATIEPDMPVRRFRITKPYAISTTEVTWDQFRQFVEATGYKTEAETSGQGGRDRAFQPDPKINWRTPGWKPDLNEPVTQVTPRDAEAFCTWLTEGSPVAPRQESRTTTDKVAGSDSDKPTSPTVRQSSRGARGLLYRLPTEAEWLHACRAGSVYKHVVGPEPGDLAEYAWTKEFLDPDPKASPLHLVGTKKANPFGLHDTLGNVWEYTRDFMSPALVPYLPTNEPLSFGSGMIVGSSWRDAQSTLHLGWTEPAWTTPCTNVGFRVLKQFDAEPLPSPLDSPLVLRAGQPMSVHALVPRPETIPSLRSWSVELAGPHSHVTWAIAASPKGDVIATGSLFTGKISLWDHDGNYRRALLGHEANVCSLDFSPDGRWLASCEYGGGERGFGGITARVWNIETGAIHAVLPLPGRAYRIKFSPNGKQLAVSFSQLYQPSFVILDLATGSTQMLSNAVRGYGLAWSPDGMQLACSHTDNHLRVWDAKTLRVLRDVEAPASEALEWSPDGRWLAMRAADRTIALRDSKTLEAIKTIGSNSAGVAHGFAWLSDSKRLAFAGEGIPNSIFDATTGEQLIKFGGSSAAIAVFDEGQQAVFEKQGRLVFYDTSTGKKLREGQERGRWDGHAWSMLSADGRDVFSQVGGTVVVSDAVNGERRRSFAVSDFYEPKPSPDGRLLGLRHHYGAPLLPLLDAQTGAKRYELLHGQARVSQVAWSSDGKWLATGATDKLVRVWNVATGKIEHELAGHTGTIWGLAWSSDGIHLASAAEDKTVRLWEVTDPTSTTRERVVNPAENTRLRVVLKATYDQFPEAINANRGGNPFHPLAWTADSRRLWIALNQHIVPLDVETGTFGPMENFSNGSVLTFLNTSPDGQRLLVRASESTFVRGRDAQDRRLFGQHLGQTSQWHPDSRRFLGWEPWYGTVGFDVETNRRLGMLFPWLTGDHWLTIGPTGHYRGSEGVEEHIVYVAQLDDGRHVTLSPADFAQRFGWKNDPDQATLLKLDSP